MPGSLSSSIVSRFSTRSGNKEYKCTVQLLDDNEETIICDIKKNDLGQVVLDYVCEYLCLVEKDYFGLRFMDINKNRYWLDLSKPIFKQIHGITPIVFCLRVRYYPADPSVVKEEITRYQLFLQLRRDMLHGRLYCPQSEAALLGAYIVQSELGDYDPDEHADGYVSEYKLFLKQTAKLEDKIAQEHKKLKNESPAGAEMNFLKKASTLDTYGFDPYTVKEIKHGSSVYVGVTHQGILIYQANRKLHHISWEDLEKVDYLGKEFRIYPKLEYFNQTLQDSMDGQAPNGNKSDLKEVGDFDQTEMEINKESKEKDIKKRSPLHILKFQCPSATFAKHLWRYTLGQQAFFTLDKSADSKPVTSKRRIPVLTRGSTFRFSGRVLHEIKECELPNREPPGFIRVHVARQPSREERAYPWMSKYSTLPKSGKRNSENQANNTAELKSFEAPELGINRPNSIEVDTVVTSGGQAPESPALELDLSPGQISTDSKETPNEESILIANSPTYDSIVEAPLLEDQGPCLVQTPLANSTPMKEPNGVVKPRTIKEPLPLVPVQEKPGVCKRIFRSFLGGLLLSILLLGIVVAVMEVRDLNFRGYLHDIPGIETFRHLYYEPSRKYMLSTYNRYVSSSSVQWFR